MFLYGLVFDEAFHWFYFSQDDVIDVDGLDKVMSAGLGRRYAFMGPLETAYLNADGKDLNILCVTNMFTTLG